MLFTLFRRIVVSQSDAELQLTGVASLGAKGISYDFFVLCYVVVKHGIFY